jgi:hypothetical protein
MKNKAFLMLVEDDTPYSLGYVFTGSRGKAKSTAARLTGDFNSCSTSENFLLARAIRTPLLDPLAEKKKMGNAYIVMTVLKKEIFKICL